MIKNIREKVDAKLVAVKAALASREANEPTSYIGLLLITLVVIAALVAFAVIFFPDLLNGLKQNASTNFSKLSSIKYQ